MELYKKAGAKYFVSMGSHHDNFFLWNSQAPQLERRQHGAARDVVGDWQKAAQKDGLRFGVSEHLGASFTWFQTSHGADKTGPQAGVPYDGADPQYQDLYHFPAEPGDTGWYSNNPRWQQQWFNEIKELVDNYHPDLLYQRRRRAVRQRGRPEHDRASTTTPTPRATAARWRRSTTASRPSDGRWVQDLERGIMDGIDPNPWQTDTSIGDWFYNRNWKFRPLSWVVHMLVDNVSKNGNLLLNVVQSPDGALEPDMLRCSTRWRVDRGSTAKRSTARRPWQVYGEKPVDAPEVKAGSFNEGKVKYTAKDIRFTTKGDVLYAFCLGAPSEDIRIASLGQNAKLADKAVAAVELLGSNEKPTWKQEANALAISKPATAPNTMALAYKIGFSK